MAKIHLSRLLGEKCWNQAKSARVTGIRASAINDIYSEFSERISLERLNRICRALDCDVSDISEYISDEPR